jgi:hypothetical protein
MKNAFLLVALILSTTVAQAWVETPTAEKAHRFVYRMKTEAQKMETFEFSSTAPSYEEAFEKAAQACYRHFKGGRRLSEDKGLDIIDVCANPRSL